MGLTRRAFYGALGGLGGTLALTGFRKVMAGFGSVGTTEPEQVIERLEELQVLNDLSPGLAGVGSACRTSLTVSGLGRLWAFCAENVAGSWRRRVWDRPWGLRPGERDGSAG